jgi:cytochrome c peroxidase
MAVSQIGAPVNAEEIQKIVAFLETLTGEQPRIVYPILPPGVAATPRPEP